MSILLTSAAVWADDDADVEKLSKIKSAYLLNFMKFAAWPDEAFENERSPIGVAVVGEDTLGEMLDRTFADRHVHDRPIVVRRYRFPSPRDYDSRRQYEEATTEMYAQLNSMHVVYICQSEDDRIDEILSYVTSKHVMTVGESSRVVRAGVVLGLALEEGRVVFYVNKKSLERQNLRISSKVLNLAKVVD